jgi:hypothetical protein
MFSLFCTKIRILLVYLLSWANYAMQITSLKAYGDAVRLTRSSPARRKCVPVATLAPSNKQ